VYIILYIERIEYIAENDITIAIANRVQASSSWNLKKTRNIQSHKKNNIAKEKAIILNKTIHSALFPNRLSAEIFK